MYSDQSKSVSVTAGALFSIAIIGYFLTPISTPEPVSTDISIPHIGPVFKVPEVISGLVV